MGKRTRQIQDRSQLILVAAAPQYVPEQSDPENHKFVWAYDISITNNSDEIVQLLHRHWQLTDMMGRMEEVHGAGVVGLQPLLKPGKTFQYRSYAQLMTPQGAMEGRYEFQNLAEEHFDIPIPKFLLSAPTVITDPYRDKLH